MEREDIKDTLEYAAELLQADPNWLDFARKPSTPDVMGDWIKRNQPVSTLPTRSLPTLLVGEDGEGRMKQTMNPDAYGLDKYTCCPVCNEMGWKLKKGIVSHFARRPIKKVSVWGIPYIQQESVLIRECSLKGG